jgi:hypothetical protein
VSSEPRYVTVLVTVAFVGDVDYHMDSELEPALREWFDSSLEHKTDNPTIVSWQRKDGGDSRW